MKNISLDQLSLADFTPLLNVTFRICLDPATTIQAKLIEATPARGISAEAAATPGGLIYNFSLVFLGPREPFLPQRIYAFEHDQIGRMILFIVPIAKVKEGYHYQAVFNRAPSS